MNFIYASIYEIDLNLLKDNEEEYNKIISNFTNNFMNYMIEKKLNYQISINDVEYMVLITTMNYILIYKNANFENFTDNYKLLKTKILNNKLLKLCLLIYSKKEYFCKFINNYLEKKVNKITYYLSDNDDYYETKQKKIDQYKQDLEKEIISIYLECAMKDKNPISVNKIKKFKLFQVTTKFIEKYFEDYFKNLRNIRYNNRDIHEIVKKHTIYCYKFLVNKKIEKNKSKKFDEFIYFVTIKLSKVYIKNYMKNIKEQILLFDKYHLCETEKAKKKFYEMILEIIFFFKYNREMDYKTLNSKSYNPYELDLLLEFKNNYGAEKIQQIDNIVCRISRLHQLQILKQQKINKEIKIYKQKRPEIIKSQYV